MITKTHIEQALELDRISYDDIYYLDLETCVEYYNKNPLIYIMLFDTEISKVIGYINFSPIAKEMFSLILSGQVIDTVIQSRDIVAYSDGCSCWGYMSSIVVHPDYRNHGYAKRMLHELNKLICSLAEINKIFFSGIVADAVSDAGYHILSKMGFDPIQSSLHDSRIMLLNPFSGNTRETDWNRSILSVYKQEVQENGFSI